jgi:hypothetical protein
VSRDQESFDDAEAPESGATPEAAEAAEPAVAGPVVGVGPLKDPQTLRPGSAVAIGVASGVAGAALLVPAVASEQRSWPLVSGVVFILVLVWLFIVHPAAIVHAQGVRLVNPVRVVDLTWPAIEEIRSRWVLELLSDGRKYSAWGVPADPERPRYGRGVLSMGANRLLGRGEEHPLPPRTRISAQAVAAELEARVAEDRRRGDSQTPRVVEQVWDRGSVALLLASAAFLVIALVAG